MLCPSVMEQWALATVQRMESQEPAMATTQAGTGAWPWLQFPCSGAWESLSKATSGKGQPSASLSLPYDPDPQCLNLQERWCSQGPDIFCETQWAIAPKLVCCELHWMGAHNKEGILSAAGSEFVPTQYNYHLMVLLRITELPSASYKWVGGYTAVTCL